jgi:hypothetical protein
VDSAAARTRRARRRQPGHRRLDLHAGRVGDRHRSVALAAVTDASTFIASKIDQRALPSRYAQAFIACAPKLSLK